MRFPLFPFLQQFFWRRQVLPAVRHRKTFAHSVIGDWKDIGPAEGENQKHFNGPRTDAADGRKAFDEMVEFLRRSKTCRTVLVEKTDRLYRNIKDYGTVDELDVEIHLVKENEVISRESRSSEQLRNASQLLRRLTLVFATSNTFRFC